MAWHDILKAPPIRNPRESEFSDNSNDNLTMPEYIDLFREKADPIIREAGEKKQKFANVKLVDLKMSAKKAKEVANELYANKGYSKILAVGDGELSFKLEGEGKV